MSIDILKVNWKFPVDEVYVLATGPNGVPHYNRIPKDARLIGVNQAIDIHEIYDVPMAIWLCADGTLPKQEWFTNKVDKVIAAGALLSDVTSPTACFSTGLLLNTYPDVPYYFTHGYTLREDPKFSPLKGMLRSGGSITAQGVQLAYWLGAKRIVLVGADMTGDMYFNKAKNLNPRLKPDGVSLHCRMLNGLCQWLKVRGTEVVSLSATALNVEVI